MYLCKQSGRFCFSIPDCLHKYIKKNITHAVLVNNQLDAQFFFIYSKTRLKRNLKGPEHFSAKARFPFNQGTLHTV